MPICDKKIKDVKNSLFDAVFVQASLIEGIKKVTVTTVVVTVTRKFSFWY
jgi:hypothetical protein